MASPRQIGLPLASRSGDSMVETQAKMIACAKFLQDWLPLYAHVAEMCDEEVPEIVEDVYSHLALGDESYRHSDRAARRSHRLRNHLELSINYLRARVSQFSEWAFHLAQLELALA
jgi:hypothetical protein